MSEATPATCSLILPPSDKVAALGDAMGHLAHDFNNLFAAISGSASLLELAGVTANPDTARHVNNIHAASARGAKIIQQLLALSPRTDLALEPVPVDDLMRDARRAAETQLGTAYSAAFIAAGNLPPLPCDRRQVLLLLAALVENARDAMPQGGSLAVTARLLPLGDEEAAAAGVKPREYLAFSVQDNGPGVTAERLPRLGEPFFTTKPKGKGAGLGLATVNRFARRHGGFVKVDTEAGAGTRVTCCFALTP